MENSKKIPDSIFYQSLPKKRMAAGALFLDEERKILMLPPSYLENQESIH